MIQANELSTPLVWIEHGPKEAADGGEETFELGVFSSYKVEERAPYLGERRAWTGDATWKRLERPPWRLWLERRYRSLTVPGLDDYTK